MIEKPNLKNVLSILSIIIIGFILIMIERTFISDVLVRRIIFYIFSILIFCGYYFFIRPNNIIKLANLTVVILIPIFILLSMIIHIFVEHNLDKYFIQSLFLWVMTIVLIYISAIPYAIYKKYIKK